MIPPIRIKLSHPLDAMGAFNKGKSSAEFVEPKKPRTPMRDCGRPTCPGVCPLKVVVQKHGTSNPAKCRVCERKFTIPPGAEKLFPAKPTSTQGNTQAKQELDKLRNQVSQLKEQNQKLHQAKTSEEDSGTKEGEELVKPSVKVSNLEKAVLVCKELGASTVDLEKQLVEAKKLLDRPGDPCRAILGKLNAAVKKEEQLTKQLEVDFKKLQTTKSKLEEASFNVFTIQNEKDQLFKEYGHDKLTSSEHFTPPEGLSPDDVQKWNDMCSEQFKVLYSRLKESFSSHLLAKSPPEEKQEGDGGQEPKAKSPQKGTPSLKPAPLPLGESEAPPPTMDIDAKGGGTKRALEEDEGDTPKENGGSSSSKEKGEELDELRLKYQDMAAKKANSILDELRQQQDAADVVVDGSASEDSSENL